MAATGASPIALMATAGHRSMATTNTYLHLAGVVFRDEAAALAQRYNFVPTSGDLTEPDITGNGITEPVRRDPTAGLTTRCSSRGGSSG